MPVADVRLMLIEATELAGMLTFTNQWLAGPDREQRHDCECDSSHGISALTSSAP